MFEDATASEVVRRRATAEPTVPKPSNATRQGELTVTRFFLISPREARGGNWHLNRDEIVAWLPWRHRAGPSATLDEARLSVVPRTIAKQSGQMQIDAYAYVDSCRALPVHHFRHELGRLAQVDEVVRDGVARPQPLEIG